jgi:hypothetical protein
VLGSSATAGATVGDEQGAAQPDELALAAGGLPRLILPMSDSVTTLHYTFSSPVLLSEMAPRTRIGRDTVQREPPNRSLLRALASSHGRRSRQSEGMWLGAYWPKVA